MIRARGRTFVLGLLALGFAACSGPTASFDPAGPCTADGRAPGAYPELEARIPATYRGEPPDVLDSGRNCSDEALGTLATAIDEVRFAGGTWTFGGTRALVLAVFSAPGLDAELLRDFYTASARDTPRVEIVGESEVTIAGRDGYRLDARRVDLLETVIVWPSADGDVVNVVLTTDLPDARIQDAIDAFGRG